MQKINTRMVQKNDTSDNWLNSDIVPLQGEIIVYVDLNKIKIGDGINKVKDLPFQTEIYISEDEPLNALTNAIWIDTSEISI